MITKTKRQKRRKNPVLKSRVDEILTELNPLYVMYLAEGDYAEIYKFAIDKNEEIENVILKKGTYVIKFLKIGEVFNDQDISYLKKLSKLKVIPRIYVITKKYMIMDFIKADTLRYRLDRMEHPGKKLRLIMNLQRMIDRLHDKGIAHGDLHFENVLIDENDDLYLIDPVTNSKNFDDDLKRFDNYRRIYLDE